MQTLDSQQIIARFFRAIALLKENKIIGGQSPFCEKYGINRRNLYLLEKDMSRDIFQVSWLGYLVRDFGLSSEWLLTGEGEVFSRLPQSVKTRVGKRMVSASPLTV